MSREVLVREVSPLEYPEFITHKYYVEYLEKISRDLRLSYQNSITAPMVLDRIADKKVKIIKAIVENLKAEERMVTDNPAYVEAAVLWLPVKSYYLIFNLTILLEYLITADSKILKSSHTKSLNLLSRWIENKDVEFDRPEFMEVKNGAEIERLKIPKSENIRSFSQ